MLNVVRITEKLEEVVDGVIATTTTHRKPLDEFRDYLVTASIRNTDRTQRLVEIVERERAPDFSVLHCRTKTEIVERSRARDVAEFYSNIDAVLNCHHGAALRGTHNESRSRTTQVFDRLQLVDGVKVQIDLFERRRIELLQCSLHDCSGFDSSLVANERNSL